jgi:hypothetical protein
MGTMLEVRMARKLRVERMKARTGRQVQTQRFWRAISLGSRDMGKSSAMAVNSLSGL